MPQETLKQFALRYYDSPTWRGPLQLMLNYKNRQTLLTARTGKLAESPTYMEIPIHPHIQPMLEERVRNIRALQQVQQLTKQQVEEVLAACVDTRPLPISIQQELRIGTVQEMAWKSLQQPFVLDHEALSTALKALDSSMAPICEGAAMLLHHSKTLAQDVQQSAAQKRRYTENCGKWRSLVS